MNDHKRQYRQHQANDRPHRPHAKKFEVVHRPVTNMTIEDEDGKRPVTTVVCQYNPLHVVSSKELHNHENYDCPDRTWNPGQKIKKFSEVKV